MVFFYCQRLLNNMLHQQIPWNILTQITWKIRVVRAELLVLIIIVRWPGNLVIVAVMAFPTNTFNVICHSHILIRLVCLLQTYVYTSPYTWLINRIAFKKTRHFNSYIKKLSEKNKIGTIFMGFETMTSTMLDSVFSYHRVSKWFHSWISVNLCCFLFIISPTALMNSQYIPDWKCPVSFYIMNLSLFKYDFPWFSHFLMPNVIFRVKWSASKFQVDQCTVSTFQKGHCPLSIRAAPTDTH